MSFISFTYNSYDRKTDQYIYTLVDSEFGSVEGSVDARSGRGGGAPQAAPATRRGAAVVKEYSKRGLPVGRNLALATIWYHKQSKYSIKDIVRWQDQYCPEYVENWQQYAAERDDALEKLLALT